MRYDGVNAAVSFRFFFGCRGVGLEPVAVIAGLENVVTMCEAVEERGGHLCITEHAGPFAKAQVGCDDDAGALVEFTQKVEQQRATRSGERQVPQII